MSDASVWPVSLHRRVFTMRKSLVALLFAAAVPTLAFAMPGGMHDGHHGGKNAPHMFQDLDLKKEPQREMRKLMGQQILQPQQLPQPSLHNQPQAQRKDITNE